MKTFFSKIKGWFVRHKPSKRRLIQLYAALLYNANIKGFIQGDIYRTNAVTKYMCVPGLNCYSCPGAVGACPLGSLQNALAKSGTTAPYYVIGIIVLFGLILGRTICGFLCPMGLLQDLTYKIKSPKLKKSKVTRVLSYLKYVILVMFVIIVPIAYTTTIPAFCKYLCPFGVIEGAIALLANPSNAELWATLGIVFVWKFCLMVLIVIGSIFVYRLFCRFLCPLGALYSFFCRIALIGVKLDKQKCIDCGLCVQTCKMDIRHVGDHECINCGDCLKVCPTKAITWKGSKIFLHASAIEEGGDSAEGEKISLYELAQSSTANGGTLQINTGAPAVQTAADAAEPAAEPETNAAEPAAEEIVPQAEEPEKTKVTSGSKALKIVYIYKTENGWTVKLHGGTARTFRTYSLAANYAQVSVKGHSALIYTRKDGKFVLSVHKRPRSPEETEIQTEEIAVEECAPAEETQPVAEEKAAEAVLTAEYAPSEPEETPAEELTEKEIKRRAKAEKRAQLPKKGTIAYVKRRNKILEACAWAVALAILFAALIYYNFIHENASADYVYSVGDQYTTLTAKKFFAEDGEDATYDIQDDLAEGKIVVLNFWYIECGGCELEIPYFGELAQNEKYADKVSVVIMHSGTKEFGAEEINSNGKPYLENYVMYTKKWTNFYQSVTWTIDTEDNDYFLELGGTSAYPITAIVDGTGTIRYMTQQSMTEEKLYEVIDGILEG